MPCNKIPYPSKQAALDDAHTIKIGQRYRSKQFGRARKNGKQLRPYECRFCPAWHLTTQKHRKY